MGDDLGGLAVHIGARVGAAAGPGDVLVSSTVAELVIGSGPRFEERGNHQLEGAPGQWRLLAVTGEHPPEPVSSAAPPPRPVDRVTMRIARSFPGAMRAATRIASRRK